MSSPTRPRARRCAAALAAVALLAGLSAQTVPAAAAEPQTARPPVAGADGTVRTWLDEANYLRSFLRPRSPMLVEDPALSRKNRLHALYDSQNRTCGHHEDPARPGYTEDGHYAARHSVLWCGPVFGAEAVDGWVRTPFHGTQVLEPRLTVTGFSDAGSRSGMDTLTHRRGGPELDAPVTWPNGDGLPLRTWWGSEIPDPMASCPREYDAARETVGQPLFAYLPAQAARAAVSEVSFGTVGGPDLPVCSLSSGPARMLMPLDALQPGTRYRGRYVAGGHVATWAFSTSGSTAARVPDAPPQVEARPGAGSATVTWVTPAQNGSPLTASTVTASPGGRSVRVPAGVTRAVVDGLSDGTAHTFTVTAANGVGQGRPSAPSAPVVPMQVPPAPTGVEAAPDDTRAAVRWSPAPAGAAVTGWTVTASPGGRTATVHGDARSAVVGGLLNGTGYTFTVTAHNLVGPGAPSAPTASVVPAAGQDRTSPEVVSVAVDPARVDVSDAPRQVRVQVRVTDDLSGVDVEGGVYAELHSGQQRVTTGRLVLTAGGPHDALLTGSATVPLGAAPGTWRVTAGRVRDAAGHAAASAASAALEVQDAHPDLQGPRVQALSLGRDAVDVAAADQEVTVTARVTDDRAGARVPFMHLQDGQGRSVVGAQAVRTLSGDGLDGLYRMTLTVPRGTANGTYSVGADLRDLLGNRSSLAPGQAGVLTVRGGVDAAPSRPEVTVTPEHQALVVSWRVLSDGGRPVTAHRVERVSTGAVTTLPPGASSLRLEGLVDGRQEVVSVVAVNDVGESEQGLAQGVPGTTPSPTASPTPVPPVPSTPPTPSASPAPAPSRAPSPGPSPAPSPTGGTAAPVAVSLHPSTISAGQVVTATYRGTPGSVVEVLARTQPATAFSRITSVVLGADGTATSTHRPQKNTRLTARVLDGPASSTQPLVAVRSVASLSAPATAAATSTFSGRVYPAVSGRLVSLYRDGRLLAQARTSATGVWSLTRRLPVGTASYQARTADDTSNLGTRSAAVRVTTR